MARFEKGRSGNPGGRPKEVGEIRALAREHTESALETLVKIMEDKKAPAAARAAAANSLLDRGYGRATTPIESSGTIEVRPQMSDRDMAIKMAFLLRKVHAELPPPEHDKKIADVVESNHEPMQEDI